MQAITGISDNPAQVMNVVADDGSSITLTLEFRPQQLGWFFSLSWNGTSPATEINGLRITCFPNILRQWRNMLSFGLSCGTLDGQEPMTADAFSSGYAQLLLLNSSDVLLIEDQVFARP